MLEVVSARNGLPTATVNNRWLHSPYDPRREARRFAAHAIDRPHPRAIVVVGAELGYAAEQLAELYPSARVLSISLDQTLSGSSVYRPQAHWDPGDDESLAGRLNDTFSDLEIAGLEVVEWNSSIRAFPTQANRVRSVLRRWITRRQASIVTDQAFGNLRLRNTLRNYLFADRALRLELGTHARKKALVIAASGPSLEAALPALRALRHDVVLWAPASGLDALLTAGLVPDLVISTDAGFYAGEHLRPACASDLPVAATVSSAAVLHSLTPVLLSEGEPVERELFAGEERHIPTIPANGTVTGSALLLADRLGIQTVAFAGLDLVYADVRSHARPHLSERYRGVGASRLNPALSQAWHGVATATQEGRYRHLRSLDTYAEWFAEYCSARHGTTYGVSLPRRDLGMRNTTYRSLSGLPAELPEPVLTVARRPPRTERVRRAEALLTRYAQRLSEARRACGAPDPLLADREIQRIALQLQPRRVLQWSTDAGDGDPIRREALFARLFEALTRLRAVLHE